MEWQVWGLGHKPLWVFSGSEAACKAFVEASDRTDLYIESPSGDEYEYDGKKWRKTS